MSPGAPRAMRPPVVIGNPDGSYHGRGTLAIDAGGRDWATGSTTMTRTMCDMVRLLERKQQQPADTEAPPLAIEPVPHSAAAVPPNRNRRNTPRTVRKRRPKTRPKTRTQGR